MIEMEYIMKKVALLSGIIISASLFTGCAYKMNPMAPKDNYTSHSDTHPKCNPCAKPTPQSACATPKQEVKSVLPKSTPVLKYDQPLRISVVGQGVAPCKGACSPAQSYALAKRAAIADAYRLIAEKVKGVYVEGNDYIKNMAVKRSTIRTAVQAVVRNANVVETTFKDGLCEVEMDITLYHAQFK